MKPVTDTAFDPVALTAENRPLGDAGSRLLTGETLKDFTLRLYSEHDGLSRALFGVLVTAGLLLDDREADARAGWPKVLDELRLFVASRREMSDVDSVTPEKDA
jgi:hypothetical protein